MSRRGHFRTKRLITSYLVLEAWPMADSAMWNRIMASDDECDDPCRGSSWSDRTVRNVEVSYGTWLKWLSDSHPQSLSEEPLSRPTKDRVRHYKEVLLAKPLAPATVQLHLQRLGQMMVAATETAQFLWLFKAANRIKPVSVRNKRARTVPSYDLAALGIQLMEKAQTLDGPTHLSPAVMFRTGLQIAFLAYRPIRLGNLTQMTVGRHLVRDESGFQVRFAGEETKTGVELEFSLPASLEPYMNTYLETYRPQLLGSRATTANLWVSRDGGHMTGSGTSDNISRETKLAFGFRVNPHMFRDCAATTIARDDPEHAFTIAGILGHTTMITSEKYYNQAGMVEAGMAVHAIHDKFRKGHFGSKVVRH